MAKRTTRVAWGLAALLSMAAVPGAIGGLLAYGRHTGAFAVYWMPY
jgi:hypothetical protein